MHEGASPRTEDEDRVLESTSAAHSLRRKSGVQFRSVPRTVDSSRMGVGSRHTHLRGCALGAVRNARPAPRDRIGELCRFSPRRTRQETDTNSGDALDSTPLVPCFRLKLVGRGTSRRGETSWHRMARTSPLPRVAWSLDWICPLACLNLGQVWVGSVCDPERNGSAVEVTDSDPLPRCDDWPLRSSSQQSRVARFISHAACRRQSQIYGVRSVPFLLQVNPVS